MPKNGYPAARVKGRSRRAAAVLTALAALRRRSGAGCHVRQSSLRESADRYHQLFEQSPDAFLLMENGVFTDCNNAALTMLQATRDEVIGHSVNRFSPEHQPDGTLSAASAADWGREAMEQGGARFEWLHRALDGTNIWADVSLTRMPADGRAMLLATIRDITDRKQAERITAIRLDLIEFGNRHSLHELLTRSLDAIGAMVRSPIGFYHFVEADQQTLSLQQWSTATLERFCKTESKGAHYRIDQAGVWVDCVHQRKPVIHNDYRSMPGKKGLPPGHAEVIREMVVPVLREDKIVAILGVGNKPVDYTEHDVKAVAFIADVTWEIVERKRAEEKLREEQVRLRAITGSAQDAIVMITPKGTIAFWNPAAERMFGYTSEEAMGQDLHQFLPPSRYQAAHQKALPLFYQTGQGGAVGKTVELEALCKDGREIPVELSMSALQFPDGWHAVGIMRDIAARKQAEEELSTINGALLRQTKIAEEMAARSEMASIAKSEFLANMSHEIRTPMNGVIGMIGLLLDTELDAEQRHYAEIVHASGESLLGLINDILDFSKIEAGKLDLELLDFDLAGFLEDFADTLAIRAHEKGLELLCSINPGTPTLLQGDPGRLRQILANLTGNAVKFTETGEVAVRVSVDTETETAALLRFTVRDTGIGIADDKIGLLFDKFSQVDASTTRRYGGTGLGLAICKQLVELMGGSIEVASEPGKGSVFQFTVQLGKQAASRMGLPIRTDLRGVRVLVVDDNATNREILTTRLTSWGMRSAEAPDGPAALAALYRALGEDDPFLIAVIDMQMPGMDGETLGRAIQVDKSLANTRMVMLTSLGSRGDARRFAEIGFAAYLNKPVRHQELQGVLSLTDPDDLKRSACPIVTRHTVRETFDKFAGSKARILLVEDNLTNQQVALGILKKLGLKADAVVNGEQAVNATETHPYDLVLMDVQMPVMDGLEATRRIRRQQAAAGVPAVPIIAMTAHAMRGDKESCLEAGMNDYLTKPVTPQILIAVLDQWLPGEGQPSGEPAVKSAQRRREPAGVAGLSVWDKDGMVARLMDDEPLARTIAAGFLDDLPRQIEALRLALEVGDGPGVERLAHTIKGAAANVGGETVRAAALAIEQATAAGQRDAAEGHMAQMETAFAQLTAVMAPFCREPRDG
ncbi:MAG: response regulator [Desulfobulbaceae bacterium]|nr:response regulator [Desulfobulbaceae bacterium]